jgi:hypothetical protein
MRPSFPPLARRAVAPLLALVLLAALAPSSASAQATRTWVSGVGDDVNPCSRTAPCRTFAGAISKTAVSGQIDALDPGAYGAVTITKAITLNGTGTQAGVLFTSGAHGVTVNAPATAAVILRGLDLNGAGTGGTGVRVLGGRSVTLVDTTIEGTTTGGVVVANSGAASVVLDGVDISDVRGPSTPAAVDVVPAAAPARADVLLRDVTLLDSDVGLRVRDRGTARVLSSVVFSNTLGVATVGDGLVEADAASFIGGNTTDIADGSNVTQEPRTTTETTTVVTPGPAPPPTVVTVPGAAPPPTTVTVERAPTPAPTAAKRCAVPWLAGLTLTTAKRRLSASGCRTGKVTRRKARRASQVGRVVTQSRKAGTRTTAGAKVALVVGRR